MVAGFTTTAFTTCIICAVRSPVTGGGLCQLPVLLRRLPPLPYLDSGFTRSTTTHHYRRRCAAAAGSFRLRSVVAAYYALVLLPYWFVVHVPPATVLSAVRSLSTYVLVLVERHYTLRIHGLPPACLRALPAARSRTTPHYVILPFLVPAETPTADSPAGTVLLRLRSGAEGRAYQLVICCYLHTVLQFPHFACLHGSTCFG